MHEDRRDTLDASAKSAERRRSGGNEPHSMNTQPTEKSESPAPALFGGLSDSERRQIAEILDRRANDVASFKYDTEKKLGQPLGDYRGSVEMAMTREVARLRRLAEKINPPTAEDDE